jgi:hypothetical protein
LFDRPPREHPAGGVDRPRITSAREAAEALFAPKRPIAQSFAAENLPPASPPAHKPRVLSASPLSISLENAEPAIRPEPPIRSSITQSQVARIRTWLKYGMTVRQVAELTGVDANEIECVLQTR